MTPWLDRAIAFRSKLQSLRSKHLSACSGTQLMISLPKDMLVNHPKYKWEKWTCEHDTSNQGCKQISGWMICIRCPVTKIVSAGRLFGVVHGALSSTSYSRNTPHPLSSAAPSNALLSASSISSALQYPQPVVVVAAKASTIAGYNSNWMRKLVVVPAMPTRTCFQKVNRQTGLMNVNLPLWSLQGHQIEHITSV